MMEAKDTVMTDGEILAICHKQTGSLGVQIYDATKQIAQAQAKISFKAGKEDSCHGLIKWLKGEISLEALCQHYLNVNFYALDEALSNFEKRTTKAGIREVVECVNDFMVLHAPQMWQAKLKEWEVE